MKNILSTLVVTACLFFCQNSNGQTSWKGTVSTLWNNAANWTNGIPDSTKDVTIGDANFTGTNQPTLNVIGSCKSIVIGGIVPSIATLSKNLSVHGNLNINSNGEIKQASSLFSVKGNWVNDGSYAALVAGSRVTMNGITQIISGSSTTFFSILTINASSTVFLGNNCNVTGIRSICNVYGVLDAGTVYKLNCEGVLRIFASGRLVVRTSNFISSYQAGRVTLNPGSTVEYTSSADQVIQPLAYSTLILNGTGTKSLSANLPLLYGRTAVDGIIRLNAGIFDLKTFTANRASTVPGGGIYIAAGTSMKLAGLNNFPSNFAVRALDVSSNVEYNGVTQTISPQYYGNLLISAAGIKSALAPMYVLGNFSMIAGTFNTNAVAVTHSVNGDFSISGGNITGANGIFSLTGTTNQNIYSTATFPNITINKAGGAAIMLSDIMVTTRLNFIKGNVETGNNVVIIPSGGAITGASETTGWVKGNLRKQVVSGASISTSFEIGENNYSPISVLFQSVSTPGELTAKAIFTDQPEIEQSGLNPAKTVNIYWSMINNAVAFTNATVTLTWPGASLDAGTAVPNLTSKIYNGTAWSMLSTANSTATSIMASGLTAFGNLSVGETMGKSVWTGKNMTADWFNHLNWLGNFPSAAEPVEITAPLETGRIFPVITGGTAVAGDLTVGIMATLTVNGTLQSAGSINATANIDAVNGTIEYNGTFNQALAPGSFVNNTIRHLVVNNIVTVTDELTITGTLTLRDGQTLNTNDFVVLKSDSNGTASVTPLPIDGLGVATAFINGKVTVERFIPARKAWRLLSAPIKSNGSTTLASTWQEGAFTPPSFTSSLNPNPGYGIHITGGSMANGFDQSNTNASSVKVYSWAAGGFVGLPASPGTFSSVGNYSGYFVYSRGDRSIDLMQGTNAAITSTTLRMKGEIKTGHQPLNVNATKLTVMGNPFPSAIDFATITRNNVKNSFYIWDPKLAGSNGLGAYVTVSWNITTSTYDITAAASNISQYIPSGQAVLVESADGINPGTITIKESDKTLNGSDQLYGRANTLQSMQLNANLYARNADGSTALLDGSMVTFNNAHSNALDAEDVSKMFGESEAISISKNGKLLAIERRKPVAVTDTIFLHTDLLKKQEYELELNMHELEKSGFNAFLKDNYLSNQLLLKGNGRNKVSFSVNTDFESHSSSRFSIIFKRTDEPFIPQKTEAMSAESEIIAFPNPVTNNMVSLQGYKIEKGIYRLDLLNLNGLVLKSMTVNHNGGVFNQTFNLNPHLPKGKYEIRLTGKMTNLNTSIIKH